jgi:hypothetical protein
MSRCDSASWNDERSFSLGFLHREKAMKKLTLAVALFALFYTTAMAQQTGQSQQTGRAGASGSGATITSGGMTSVGSGRMTGSGIREDVTGMSERSSSNGSPVAAPKATTGPNDQPSNNDNPPK